MADNNSDARRKRSEAFSSTSSTDELLDFKRIKTLLSISDSEPDTDIPTEMEMEQVKQLLESILDDKLKTLIENTSVIRAEMENIKRENMKLKSQVFELETEVAYQRKELLHVKQGLIRNEQYSRRQNVRIFGIKEEESENTKQTVIDCFSNKLKVNLNQDDIEIAHRLPSRNADQERPIIVKFKSRDTKIKVIKERKLLKGSNIYINDDLCREIYMTLNRLKNTKEVDSSWCQNETIFAKINGKRHIVPYGVSLEDIIN